MQLLYCTVLGSSHLRLLVVQVLNAFWRRSAFCLSVARYPLLWLVYCACAGEVYVQVHVQVQVRVQVHVQMCSTLTSCQRSRALMVKGLQKPCGTGDM